MGHVVEQLYVSCSLSEYFRPEAELPCCVFSFVNPTPVSSKSPRKRTRQRKGARARKRPQVCKNIYKRSKAYGEILSFKMTGTYDHPSYGLDK